MLHLRIAFKSISKSKVSKIDHVSTTFEIYTLTPRPYPWDILPHVTLFVEQSNPPHMLIFETAVWRHHVRVLENTLISEYLLVV